MSENNQNIFSNLSKYNNRIALYENDRLSYTYKDILFYLILGLISIITIYISNKIIM